jgi:hypothetical protein
MRAPDICTGVQVHWPQTAATITRIHAASRPKLRFRTADWSTASRATRGQRLAASALE